MFGRLSSKKRVSIRINRIRRTLCLDTQHTRRKLIVDLEQIFEIASNYARGEVKRVSDEKGKSKSSQSLKGNIGQESPLSQLKPLTASPKA